MGFLSSVIRFLYEAGWEGFHNFFRFLPPPIGPALCKNNAKLDGKVAIVTGASAGLGKETALQLAKRGAKVIMACRDTTKGNSSADDIITAWPPADLQVEKLDLASLKSVRNFAMRINRSEPRIDYLINNAGVTHHPLAKSEDGIELHFATNYLGHFLLTLMLSEKLTHSPDPDGSKIINIASMEHLFGRISFDDINMDKKYDHTTSYAQSKLAVILFTQELAKRLSKTNCRVYAIHPGLSRTDAFKYLTGILKLIDTLGLTWFKLSPFLGVQTTLFCLLEESVKDQSGGYFSYCKKGVLASIAKAENGADELQRRLWDVSCAMVGLGDENYASEKEKKKGEGEGEGEREVRRPNEMERKV